MSDQPQRMVENNMLTSTDLPHLKVQITDAFEYVGRLQFVLYDCADVDLFVFAASDDEQRARRLIMVQFEQFQESNDKTYNYPSSLRASLGSHDYIRDNFVTNLQVAVEARPDSDSARAINLLRERGYELPDDVISTRFVRMVDDTRRKEVLFSYSEDLGGLGLTAEDLAPEGKAAALRDTLEQGVYERALAALAVIED